MYLLSKYGVIDVKHTFGTNVITAVNNEEKIKMLEKYLFQKLRISKTARNI
jgi:hypothetical protein